MCHQHLLVHGLKEACPKEHTNDLLVNKINPLHKKSCREQGAE